jgi:pimeloyl-ACP methyl ester carboxylesterase
VEAEYEVASPLLSRILLRMGEAPEYDNWARLPEEERSKTRRPDIKIYWRKEFPAKTPISPEELRDSAFRYSVYLEPEHNSRAREIYRQVFPYFEDLDPLNVTPLIAHVPLLIVSGAQDSQFKPSGVVEVDEATQAAYRKFDLSVCSELYLEPRADHWVDPTASSLIAAFYERWLR